MGSSASQMSVAKETAKQSGTIRRGIALTPVELSEVFVITYLFLPKFRRYLAHRNIETRYHFSHRALRLRGPTFNRPDHCSEAITNAVKIGAGFDN
jgi:hypothetical protein